MNKKFAILANIIDPLFISVSDRKHIIVCCLENSHVHTFLKENNFTIIPYSPHKKKANHHTIYEDTVLRETDLVEKFKENSIETLIVGHILSPSMVADAKKNNITLLSIPFSSQKLLNNKNKFHDLLIKYQISVPEKITQLSQREKDSTYVVQKVQSFSMLGTFFLKGSEIVLETFSARTLVRKFQSGIPLGISIFLDTDGNYFVSALRRQCFEYKNGLPHIFLGIQWMPTNFFSKDASTFLQTELHKLIDLLKSKKIVGCVNIDLIIDSQKSYIIECNPRLSSATTQVFGTAELRTYTNSWKFYTKALTKTPNDFFQNIHIPPSNFQGSVLDIDINKTVEVKTIMPIGVYEWNGSLKFVTHDISKLSTNKNYFFLFHELSQKNTKWKNFTLCSIISNFPLFDIESGELNRNGQKIQTIIKNNFLNYES